MIHDNLSPVTFRTIPCAVDALYEEKKSRFLAHLAPLHHEKDALITLQTLRESHPDARHHSYAYRLQTGIERASDDGEPGGTAGRPMLHVLQQQALTDCIIVVTRYFGGILLGAGGLVRAYTEATSLAVQAATIVTYVEHDRYRISIPYASYDLALHRLNHAAWHVQATFGEVVTLIIEAPSADRMQLAPILNSLCHDDQASVPEMSGIMSPRSDASTS